VEKNLLLFTSLGQGAFYSTRKGRNSMDEKTRKPEPSLRSEHIETRLDQVLRGQTHLIEVVLILGKKVETLTEIEIRIDEKMDAIMNEPQATVN